MLPREQGCFAFGVVRSLIWREERWRGLVAQSVG